jgi:hypothetical protein
VPLLLALTFGSRPLLDQLASTPLNRKNDPLALDRAPSLLH